MIKDRNEEEAREVLAHIMFFEDIIFINSKDMTILISNIDKADIIKAMKNTTPEIKNHFLQNISKRAAKILNEEIKFSNNVNEADSFIAQKKIAKIMHDLSVQNIISVSKQ